MLAAGQRLDHEILAAACAFDPRVPVREAVAAQLVVADDEGFYAFRHALLREVVVDDLLPGERASLHLALARALEARAEGLPGHGGAHLAAGIAHHYLASGDQPAALAASVRAAQAAEAVHANGEAAALYARALQLWDRVADAEALTGHDHVELLRSAAWTNDREHEPARAESYLRAAITELGDSDPVRTAQLLELVARQQFGLGRSAAAAETRREALELLPEGPSGTRATLLAGMAKELMLESRLQETVEVADEAIEVARAVGDEVSELRALDAKGVVLFGMARYEEGERALREVMERSQNDDLFVLPAHAREPGRLARGRRPARRGAQDRRRRAGAGGGPRDLAALADAAARRARVRGGGVGRGRGRAAFTRPPGAGHDVHQRRAAADRAGAGPGRARRARACCSTRPATSPATRASRSGSGRSARCGRSWSAAPATSSPPPRRSTTRWTGSTSAPRTSRGWPACRPPARACTPTRPCGPAISARTRPCRSPWRKG